MNMRAYALASAVIVGGSMTITGAWALQSPTKSNDNSAKDAPPRDSTRPRLEAALPTLEDPPLPDTKAPGVEDTRRRDTGPPLLVETTSTKPTDPMNDVDEFVRQGRERVTKSIAALTAERQALRERLARVESALSRWEGLARSLQEAPPTPTEIPPVPLPLREDGVAFGPALELGEPPARPSSNPPAPPLVLPDNAPQPPPVPR